VKDEAIAAVFLCFVHRCICVLENEIEVFVG
jgi:hypothetical protein